LPSGKLLGKMFRPVTDFHPFKNRVDSLFTVAGFHFKVDKRKLDILIDIEFINKVEALKNKAYIAFAKNRSVAFPEICNLRSVKQVASRSWIVK
jgi:hypothetical protein